jgi:hypothetical protein
MSKIPTAEEFLQKDCNSFSEALIEFAKLHVHACKKEMIKVAYVKDPITGVAVYSSSARLNKAYPLDKIK